jgi:AraC-like DNA-binding protein
MSPLEKQELIGEELAAFRERLPECSNAPPTVRIATERLHEKLFDPGLTMERLRNHLGITGDTFSVRFRQHHGHTPKCYARNLRVKAAERLLGHDELTATSVALAVGYEHYRSFARVFKRHAKCTPSTFQDASLG